MGKRKRCLATRDISAIRTSGQRERRDYSGAYWTRPRAKRRLSHKQKRRNTKLSNIRAKVEHPFRVVKRQVGYIKTRYRGLKKNAAQVFTLFALANLYRVRRALLAYC